MLTIRRQVQNRAIHGAQLLLDHQKQRIHPLELQIPVSILFQLRIGMLFFLIISKLNNVTTRRSPLILDNHQDSCQRLATVMLRDIIGRNPLR